MMNLQRLILLVLIAAYLSVRLLRESGLLTNSFLANHFSDLICMPVVLIICLEMVRFVKRKKTIYLHLIHVFGLCLFYAIFFEWYLPLTSSRYTADYRDVLMYFIGGLLFCSLQYTDRRLRKRSIINGVEDRVKGNG